MATQTSPTPATARRRPAHAARAHRHPRPGLPAGHDRHRPGAFRPKPTARWWHRDGKVVGSALIGQAFTRPVMENGLPKPTPTATPSSRPDPTYFQSRPSAAGAGYDPLSTSASNLGPENADLIASIQERRAAAASSTASTRSRCRRTRCWPAAPGSTRTSARRTPRSRSRGSPASAAGPRAVRRLVREHTQGRILGFLGEPHVNVLELNLALDAAGRMTADASDCAARE